MSLAHSSPDGIRPPDPYARHVSATEWRADDNARRMLEYAIDPPPGLRESIRAAAIYHDLGKLDPDIQAALASGRGASLPWDHIDAGVAYLRSAKEIMAAWLVRAHHAPGLPSLPVQFDPELGLKLRGRRGERSAGEHAAQIARTDAMLPQYLEQHRAAVGDRPLTVRRASHGLTMRLALSCLVDADHSDTAAFDDGPSELVPAPPRWNERLDALRAYVATLGGGSGACEVERNELRTAFFEACLESPLHDRIVSCDALVGSGKTTSVLAYLLQRARAEGLRRIIVVAPYTNILTQTARRLREALVLPGENPEAVVVEHHHRADFDSRDSRELAVTWSAPIVLTTAVSFFEALAGCSSAAVRKLHNVAGSAIMLDEAHAALPTTLWRQNWCWVRELCERWSCRVVLASGSLARFWEEERIVGEARLTVPDILPRHLASKSHEAESRRIAFRSLASSAVTVDNLVQHVAASPGPRLVILNTVQSAAIVAVAMREAGMAVYHLSTALAPRDRERILVKVDRQLRSADRNWVLVATSCVEAGVDFSFRSGFRQSFSTASTIQVGGRVNRHGEYNEDGGGIVFDFDVTGPGITAHPAAKASAQVLHQLMRQDALNACDPARLVTDAMREELRLIATDERDPLGDAERAQDYPAVSKHGRVIASDTRLVVVHRDLIDRIRRHQRISFRDLLAGSVQLWTTKVSKLALEEVPGHRELYFWPTSYDPAFLGIMAGILEGDAYAIPGGLLL